jgi:hypothetical protein
MQERVLCKAFRKPGPFTCRFLGTHEEAGLV